MGEYLSLIIGGVDVIALVQSVIPEAKFFSHNLEFNHKGEPSGDIIFNAIGSALVNDRMDRLSIALDQANLPDGILIKFNSDWMINNWGSRSVVAEAGVPPPNQNASQFNPKQRR